MGLGGVLDDAEEVDVGVVDGEVEEDSTSATRDPQIVLRGDMGAKIVGDVVDETALLTTTTTRDTNLQAGQV